MKKISLIILLLAATSAMAQFPYGHGNFIISVSDTSSAAIDKGSNYLYYYTVNKTVYLCRDGVLLPIGGAITSVDSLYARAVRIDSRFVVTGSVNGKINMDYTELTTAADPTRYNDFRVDIAANQNAASDGLAALYSRINWAKDDNSNVLLHGVEGVASSSKPDESTTLRGGYFRTYVQANADAPGATARSNFGVDISPRAGYLGSNAANAESGSAFVGARIWMAPHFASTAGINNFHGLWIYNEHPTNAVTNAIMINDAGGTGGWTNGLNFTGSTITNEIVGSQGEYWRNTTNDKWSTDAAVIVEDSISIGKASATDNIVPYLRLKGDADSDASATTSETLGLTLTGSATSTNASWYFSSTQAYGFYFDRVIRVGNTTGNNAIVLNGTEGQIYNHAVTRGYIDFDYPGITLHSGTLGGLSNIILDIGDYDAGKDGEVRIGDKDAASTYSRIDSAGVYYSPSDASVIGANVTTTGSLGVGTVTPQHKMSLVGATPILNIIDSDVNKLRTSVAQATDTTSITIDASGTQMAINFANATGQKQQIASTATDQIAFTGGSGGYTFDDDILPATGSALTIGSVQWDVAGTDSINGASIGARTITGSKHIAVGTIKSNLVDSIGVDGLVTNVTAAATYQTICGQTIMVAKSGGDYTTIGAAITHAGTHTPSATNLFTIEVYPGVYTEQVTMASYVNLKGIGTKGSVVIFQNTADAIILADNVEISDLTVRTGNGGSDLKCFKDNGVACDVKVNDVVLESTETSGTGWYGFYLTAASNLILDGIYVYNTATAGGTGDQGVVMIDQVAAIVKITNSDIYMAGATGGETSSKSILGIIGTAAAEIRSAGNRYDGDAFCNTIYGEGGTIISNNDAISTLYGDQIEAACTVIFNGGFTKRSVTAGISAISPGVQGDCPLTSEINVISVCGTTNDAVTLTTAEPGKEIMIINNGAQTLEIFPASGDDLGAGVNTATTLIAGANITFVAYNTTNWEIK